MSRSTPILLFLTHYLYLVKVGSALAIRLFCLHEAVRLLRMHKMQTIVTDDRCVSSRRRVQCVRRIRCSLCQITSASCYYCRTYL